MGFGAKIESKREEDIPAKILAQILPEDLLKYGLIPGICRQTAGDRHIVAS